MAPEAPSSPGGAELASAEDGASASVDGWAASSTRATIESIRGSKRAEADISAPRWPWRRAELSRGVRSFYRSQNALIDELTGDATETLELLEARSPGAASSAAAADARQVRWALHGSLALNVALLVAKVFAVVTSGSMSVIASAADSLLDLVSGGVMTLTQRAMSRADPYRYPQGKARMEPLGVVVFAAVMGMSSLQIIVEAAKEAARIATEGSTLTLDAPTFAVLGATILGKWAGAVACRAVARKHGSVACEAYAQDHRNDVLTNLVGAGAVSLAWAAPGYLSYLDPVGAIAIALYILYSWASTALEHIAKLAGLAAPPELLQRLTAIAVAHDERVVKVDTVRAYHFGEEFLVEVDLVLPPAMSLREAHDIGESLQRRLEALRVVARAFVHLDWNWEHRIEH